MLRKLVPVLVGLVLVWLAWDSWTDDARRIDRRLAQLQKLAAKSPVETQFEGAAKAKKITDLFAGAFELRAEPEGFATANRQDLVRGIMSYRARSRTLVVQVGGRELFVDPGGAEATHYLVVEFLTDLGDLRGAARYPVRIRWVKEDREWLIQRLEVLPEAAR